ncbi:MAG TPA: LamG-like jellyroll fold domain-containing protein [Actinocrinis sp.]|nr:LamG-like jellyroll fold domain-containing protein [Actinocrinis sp.]
MTACAGLLAGVTGVAPACAGTKPPSGPAVAQSTDTAAKGPLTALAASARARATGKAVAVDSLTTATTETTAQPDGSFVYSSSLLPTRVLRGDTWTDLDANLAVNKDGSLSPAASTDALRLSGGGNGRLATLDSGGRTLTVTLPATLPAPTVSGPTATYADVLTGVNLVVTADEQGGFSDVFVVTTPQAAADPKLPGLLTAGLTTTGGLTVRADADGVLEADDKAGQALFTAPAPRAWDSNTLAPGQSSPTQAAATPAGAHPATPTAPSSVTAPGSQAHVADLGTSLKNNTLTLTAPASLAADPAQDFPLYYDPAWGPTASNGGVSSWTSVNSYYSTRAYPDSSKGQKGQMEVGYCGDTSDPNPCNPVSVSRSFLTLNTSGVPAGAVVTNSTVGLLDDWSTNCTGEEIDLYQTGTISNSTTWMAQPAWISKLASTSQVGGNTCANKAVGFSGTALNSAFQSAGHSNLTIGLRAADESNDLTWRQYSETNTTFSVTYDLVPTFGALTTSPGGACTNGNPVGKGSITLYAPVDSPAGNNLTTSFTLTKSGSSTNLLTSGNTVSGGNTTATLPVAQTILDGAAGGTTTTFDWSASTTDGTLSANSPACSFTYNPNAPGQPTVTATGSPLCTSSARVPIGTTCSFSVVPADDGSSIPISYTYQLNSSVPSVAPASSGDATFSIQLPQEVNTLTVIGVSSGGDVGQAYTTPLDAAFPTTPTTDGDLDGNGTPDLIVPGGGATGMPAGLWYAAGTPNGTVAATPANIGVAGLSSTGSASDWTGTQALTGDYCGDDIQDIFDYNPASGGATILCNDGSADTLTSTSPANSGQSPPAIAAGSFNDGSVNAQQVVNAGSTASTDGGGGSALNSDMFAVTDNNLYLYSPSGLGDYYTADDLTGTPSPDGTTDWDSWTLASAQIGGATDLFLWDKTTGALDLWTGLTAGGATLPGGAGTDPAYPGSTVLTSTHQYNLATSGWNTGAAVTLRAADLNNGPVLWVTGTSGLTTTVATVAPNSTDTGLSSPAGSPQTLTTATHAWQFQDMGSAGGNSGSAITTTADTGNAATPLPLTGSATGATWNVGSMFSPDAALNGTTGSLATSAGPLDLTKSFTLSAWVDPTVLGGVALSQSGSADSGLTVIPTASGWAFALNTGAGTAATYDTITGGTVSLGAWTEVTATYNYLTKVTQLYVDNTLVASGDHTAPATGATGVLKVGVGQTASAPSGYFTGQIAQVQLWNTVQPPAPNPSAPSYHHSLATPTRILDTRSGLGMTGGVAGAVPANSALPVQIAGVAGMPSSHITAVEVELTVTSPTQDGYVAAYADTAQQPMASGTNFSPTNTVTGTEIVPVGTDGKIDLFNSSFGTVQLILDVTGYYSSDPTATGRQTYHPLSTSARVLDSRSDIGGLNGNMAADSTFTLQVTGSNGVPSNATAVAINITAINGTGSGFLAAYSAALTSVPTMTTLTYNGSAGVASLAGDVAIDPANGSITIANQGAAGGTTGVIGDITGYFTTDTTGLDYHSTNPTRLVDTRSGIGGTTGTVAAEGTFSLTAGAVAPVTTAVQPTLALIVTATQETSFGDAIVYPGSLTPVPSTSNLNWIASQDIANLTFTTTNTSNAISILNQSSGTIKLVIDCSGYFSTD